MMMALTMHHSTNVSLSSENPAPGCNNQDQLDDHRRLEGVEKAEKKLVRQGSVSENFFAVKNASLILPKQNTLGEPVEGMKSMKFGGDLKTHLYGIISVVRSQDKIKLVARLEGWDKERMRYLVIVSTIGRQDTEESIILGIDFAKNEHKSCTIGLVIPIWSDMAIQLDGDGGFKVSGSDRTYTFKPISVQALWSAIQALHRCTDIAWKNNYYIGSLYLTWTCYYESRLHSCRLFTNEWEYHDEVWSRRPNYYSDADPARERTELKIRGKLKAVMMKMDLDNCNSRDIRQALEKDIDLDLKQYKEYIDTEMLTILGQMDTASKILDCLFLGSEWNASNLEELNGNGITHILNITMEIDNFFPDHFTYKNIRCYDEETTDLLPFWNDTWKFIKLAKRSNGKCLVHCKMGISRSAATVAAFIMKTNHWSMEKALSYVRERRPIIFPNSGFMMQLHEYEGILNASAQRHNQLFRSLSESNLLAEHAPPADKEDENSSRTPSQPQIDFNRQLLDITSLMYRPSHKRCKSWSPGDTKSYDPDDITSPDQQEDGCSMNTAPLSEPQEVFASRHSSVEARPTQSNESSVYKKKRWRRRHTERVFTMPEFDLDAKPQSEDSVFVNPGIKIQSYAENSLIGLRTAWKSSQACKKVNDHKDELAVKPLPTHSSLASPMSSPSFKCTEKVSVSALKSHFNEESTLKVELCLEEAVIVQSERADTVAPLSYSGRSSSASENTPESEDIPKDDKRAPAPFGRSMSDSQVCHVKKFVSDIELRYGEGKNSIRDRSVSDVPRTGALPPESPTESLENLACLPEVAIIEKEANVNNSNNNNIVSQDLSHRVLNLIDDADATPSSSNEPKPDAETGVNSSASPVLSKSRSLTQSELQIIREVGKTFLGEMTHAVPDDVSEGSGAAELLPEDSRGSRRCSADKKSGIVRRMARIIEKRIKKQKTQKSQQQTSAQPDKHANLPGSDKSTKELHASHPVFEASLSAQEQTFSFYEPQRVIVKENLGPIRGQRPDSDKLFTQTEDVHLKSYAITSSTASNNQKHRSDLFSLIGPTPYDPARTFSSVKRVEFKGRQAVRRSQSERSFVLRCKPHFSRYRSKRSAAVSRPGDCGGGYIAHPQNVEVKRIVKLMEEGPPDGTEDKSAASVGGIDADHATRQSTDPSSFVQHDTADKRSGAGCDDNTLPSRAKSCWLRRDSCLYQTI